MEEKTRPAKLWLTLITERGSCMSIVLPIEPMSYKHQIKENESLIKLKMIRLVKSAGCSQKQVAITFQCHRNTVGSIIKRFDQLEPAVQTQLLANNNLSLEQIEQYLTPLLNKSCKPHSHPSQASECQEAAIAVWLFGEKGLRVGPYQMKTLIERRFANSSDPFLQSLVKLGEGQIKGIYKRYNLKTKKRKTSSGAKTHLYDYHSLACFQECSFDTKHILDKKALPQEIYEKFIQANWMPRYQWTFQEAKTRSRLLAYSYNLNAEFGLKFLLFCVMYIRYLFNNYSQAMKIGLDQGSENCSGSTLKLEKWNQVFKLLNCELYQYHVGNDIRKNLIERSHLTDDRFFYLPRADYINSKDDFLQEAAGYYHYFNFIRPHSGVQMNKRTPFEIIKEANFIKPERLMQFPTMILEDEIHWLSKATEVLLLQAELNGLPENKRSELETLINLSDKYDFFEPENAQRELTYYRENDKSRKTKFKKVSREIHLNSG